MTCYFDSSCLTRAYENRIMNQYRRISKVAYNHRTSPFLCCFLPNFSTKYPEFFSPCPFDLQDWVQSSKTAIFGWLPSGHQRWLAGKSCENGDFNGRIIHKCWVFMDFPLPCWIPRGVSHQCPLPTSHGWPSAGAATAGRAGDDGPRGQGHAGGARLPVRPGGSSPQEITGGYKINSMQYLNRFDFTSRIINKPYTEA